MGYFEIGFFPNSEEYYGPAADEDGVHCCGVGPVGVPEVFYGDFFKLPSVCEVDCAFDE